MDAPVDMAGDSVPCPACKKSINIPEPIGREGSTVVKSLLHLPEPQPTQSRIDADEHCYWFKSLQDRYKWTKSEWDPIDLSIAKLTKRASDNRLFLGVIGEFSSGKTTLINAFLGEALLKTDILPATTCAATILEYGTKVDAVIRLNSGKTIRRSESGISLFGRLGRKFFTYDPRKELDRTREFIHRYTAQESQACTVHQVDVTHPNNKLKSGLVIVDTPGINVENPRHAAITRHAVHNICDAVIIIIPAPAACSQTLISFINENLAGVLHRCIVIVTKIDLIPSRERERLMQYVSSRLERECEGLFTAVFSTAPCFVLNNHEFGSASVDSPEIASFSAAFHDTEKAVFSILESSRHFVIAEQLLQILINILSQLENAVRKRKTKYLECHDALERNRLPNLKLFVEGHKQRFHEMIDKSARSLNSKVVQGVSEIRERLDSASEKDILCSSNKKVLKVAVTEKMQIHFNNSFVDLTTLSRSLHTDIVALSDGCHADFQKVFAERYRSLSTLGGLIVVCDDTVKSLSFTHDSISQHAHHSSASVVDAVRNAEIATAGGAAVGATIGTFIMPVVGTIIGGALGWLASTFFGPSMEELKQTAITNSRGTVAQWAQECEAQMEQLVDDHINKSKQSLALAIDNYAKVYDVKVREMMRKDEESRLQLEKYVILAERDLEDLKSRETRAKTLLENSKLTLSANRKAK